MKKLHELKSLNDFWERAEFCPTCFNKRRVLFQRKNDKFNETYFESIRYRKIFKSLIFKINNVSYEIDCDLNIISPVNKTDTFRLYSSCCGSKLYINPFSFIDGYSNLSLDTETFKIKLKNKFYFIKIYHNDNKSYLHLSDKQLEFNCIDYDLDFPSRYKLLKKITKLLAFS